MLRAVSRSRPVGLLDDGAVEPLREGVLLRVAEGDGEELRELEGAGELLREGAALREEDGAGELLREGAALREGAGTEREAVRGAGAGALRDAPPLEPMREPPLEPLEPPEPPRVLRWASICVKGVANSVNAATINPEKMSLRGVSIACLHQRPGASLFQSDPERKKEPPGIPASKGPLRPPV